MDDRTYWVGTYTRGKAAGRGIYRARHRDGRWQEARLAAETASPSYLALHPTLPMLYAVSEENDRAASAVTAFEIVEDGGLRPAGTVPVPAGPCHLAVDPDGRALVSASYVAGTLNAVPLDTAGRFAGGAAIVEGQGGGSRADRQEGPHAHAAMFAPDGTVLSTDLGADLVRVHRLTGDGALRPCGQVRLPPGCGPRHLALHPSGHVYVLTELARTLVVLRPGGGYADLRVVAESPATAAPADGSSLCAAIAVSGDGRFVYTTTRGADVLTTHEVAGDGGGLRPLADTPCGGRWPRDFTLAGRHLHVAHEHSGTITTFEIDPATGLPHPTNATTPIPAPSCIIPAGAAAQEGTP